MRLAILATSFFCMFAISKSVEMSELHKTQDKNDICGVDFDDITISICGDANHDNVPFFDSNDFEYFDWGTFLPHWHQDGKFVFVTFRLHDSLPIEKLQQLHNEKESWMKCHPQPWSVSIANEYIERFGKAVDKWLDSGHGDCLLKKPDNRKIVEKALHYFDGKRYDLQAYVVMPNHVHMLIQLKAGFELNEIMRSIKSFTAKEINKCEKRTGSVWQSESYDRLIRDPKHFENVVRYIIANNKELAWVKKNTVADCVSQSNK